jgi:hypothetical protein
MLSIVASRIIYPELIIRSCVSIATNLVTSVNYLVSISKSDIELQSMLTTNDIIEDINIIKTFIEEKQTTNHSETVRICIYNLSNTLSELEKNIKSITIKIETHKQLWFNYFRSYNIGEEKKQIPFLINKMKHRFELLIKICANVNN